jgi:hypothetical protein
LARVLFIAPKHLVKGFAQAFTFHELLVLQWAHMMVAVAAAALKGDLQGLVGRVVGYVLDV